MPTNDRPTPTPAGSLQDAGFSPVTDPAQAAQRREVLQALTETAAQFHSADSAMITDDRIAKISPRLERALRGVASPEYPISDLFQIAVLAIIEQSTKEPDFASHEDGYIVQRGVWAARTSIASGERYNYHVPASLEDSDITPDYAGDPAQIVERRETLRALIDTVGELDDANQVIVTMLYYGAAKGDIAAKLGISRGAVSHRIGRIAHNAHRPI